MKTCQSAFLSAAAALMLLPATSASAANYDFAAAIVTENNNCLIPGGDRGIYVMKCTQGGARYSIVDGRVRTADGLCFDHGVVKGSNPGNNARHIKLVPCHSGKSQVWYFMTSGTNVNLAQNAANSDVCMNIEGNNDRPGTRLLVWNCGFNRTGPGERFYLGGRVSANQLRQIPQSTINKLATGGSAMYPNGVRLVAAGGGNLVAAGGGNLVAAGGGNLVAAGGGNIVAAGGGNLVNSLIGNDGSTLRSMQATFRP
jgi:Ricin-type beta-trefoil lectin domain